MAHSEVLCIHTSLDVFILERSGRILAKFDASGKGTFLDVSRLKFVLKKHSCLTEGKSEISKVGVGNLPFI